jgi:hypothetical protein
MCLYIDVIVDDDFQLKVVERNEKTTNGYQPNVAEFDLVMQVWIFFCKCLFCIPLTCFSYGFVFI